jgi:hypothetical protein
VYVNGQAFDHSGSSHEHRVRRGRAAQEPTAGLPDSPAKGMVEGVCTGCHQTSEILRSSGYTRAGWKGLTSTMVDLSASPVEREQITEYPRHPLPTQHDAGSQGHSWRRGEEWPLPSGPKSHPYAIAVVDGIIWYNESGMQPDMLVRFDPKTESFQSWPIPSGGIYAGIVRHMRPTRDGNLLIHQSSTNRILLVTPLNAVATR